MTKSRNHREGLYAGRKIIPAHHKLVGDNPQLVGASRRHARANWYRRTFQGIKPLKPFTPNFFGFKL